MKEDCYQAMSRIVDSGVFTKHDGSQLKRERYGITYYVKYQVATDSFLRHFRGGEEEAEEIR